MATKYFIYSAQQLDFRKKQESRMGKMFRVGQVFINGSKKAFTELCSSESNRFTDGKVVASGDPDTMTYTLPTST